LMQRFTLDVLGKAVYDYEFNYLDGESDILKSYNFAITETANVLRVILPFYELLPLESTGKFKQATMVLRDLAEQLVTKSRSKQAEAKNCLLDFMITEEQQDFTHEELLANINVLFIAGHETTSVALTWVLYLLAKHPTAQDKLYNELMQYRKQWNTSSNGNETLLNSLGNIEYLNWVIKEGMRLYPPLATLPSRMMSDKSETLLGYNIPSGTLVNVCVFSVHHDEKYWPNPFEFRPERFSHEESANRPSYAYLPFGLGVRTCLGNNFSLQEQRIFISLLLEKYELVLEDPDLELKCKTNSFIHALDEPVHSGGIVFKKRGK